MGTNESQIMQVYYTKQQWARLINKSTEISISCAPYGIICKYAQYIIIHYIFLIIAKWDAKSWRAHRVHGEADELALVEVLGNLARLERVERAHDDEQRHVDHCIANTHVHAPMHVRLAGAGARELDARWLCHPYVNAYYYVSVKDYA